MASSLTISKGIIFGVKLDSTTSSQLEYFVDRCLVWLTKKGITQQGLFRIAGSQVQILDLKQAINKDPMNLSFENQPVHNIASLLKSFFRELQEPLLTFDLYNSWIACADMRRQENIKDCLLKLPSHNRVLLSKFCSFLYEVQKNQDTNKMNSRNLATCLGPGLLRPRVDNPETVLKDAGLIIDLFTVLIEDYEYYFLGKDKKDKKEDLSHVLQRPDWRILKPDKPVRVKIFTEGQKKGLEKNFSSNISDESGKLVLSSVVAGDIDGVYEICFTPPSHGLYTFEVMFDFKNVMGSPLTINVPTMLDIQSLPSLVTKAVIRPVHVHNQTQGIALQPFRFTTGRVASKDGDTIQFAADQYSVEVTGPDTLFEGKVTKILGTGGLEVEILPEKEGPHKIQVYVRDTPVLQRPLIVKIKAQREAKIEAEKERLQAILDSVRGNKKAIGNDTVTQIETQQEEIEENNNSTNNNDYPLELDEIEFSSSLEIQENPIEDKTQIKILHPESTNVNQLQKVTNGHQTISNEIPSLGVDHNPKPTANENKNSTKEENESKSMSPERSTKTRKATLVKTEAKIMPKFLNKDLSTSESSKAESTHSESESAKRNTDLKLQLKKNIAASSPGKRDDKTKSPDKRKLGGFLSPRAKVQKNEQKKKNLKKKM